jgi:catecholate siderophore receptor
MKKKHNYRRKSPENIALTSLLCAMSNLNAQTAPPPANAEKKADASLPEIVVSAEGEKTYKAETVSSPKYTKPLIDIPQTINVIPKAVIEERGASSLRDVLRNVPGISMQAGEGGGGPAGDNLSIRGFAARSDIFVDGIRDTAGGGYSRDPFNLEQIEVTKGPSSATVGRGSTGGSINLSTKAPTLDRFYRGDIGVGSSDYFRSTLDINVPLWMDGAAPSPAPSGKEAVSGKEPVAAPAPAGQTGAAFRLNAMYHNADYPGREDVNNERWGVAPSVSFGLGTNTRFTLNWMHLDQDNVPDYGIPWVPRNSVVPGANGSTTTINNTGLPSGALPDYLFDNYYGNLNRDYERIKTDLVTGIFEHDFSDRIKWRTAVRWGRNDRDSVTTAPRFIDRDPSSSVTRYDNTELTRQFQSRDQVDDALSLQSDLRVDFETGAVKHQLVAGVELSREDSHNDVRVLTGPAGSNPNTNVFNPNPNDPFTGTISHNGAYTDTSSDTAAIYVFDAIDFTKQWTLTLGGRWDSPEVDYKSRTAAPDLTVTPLHRDDSLFSYRVALNYKPVDYGTFYAGYGTSFNTSTENLTYIAAPTSSNNTLSLFEADPEKNKTFEVGTKWDILDEKLSLTGAIFRTEKTNARTTDPADPTVVNLTGEQVVQGFEVGFNGAITDKWRIIGGYTYLDSEVKKSDVAAEVGNEVSNTPEHSFSLWTIHELPAGFQVGVGAQYVGDRYNNNNSLTRQKADSYVVVDAMVNYKVNDHMSLRLNGYNLFNEKYLDRVGGGHSIPGAGRSVSLTASLSF